MIYPSEYFTLLSIIRNVGGQGAARALAKDIGALVAGTSAHEAVAQALSDFCTVAIPWALMIDVAVKNGDIDQLEALRDSGRRLFAAREGGAR